MHSVTTVVTQSFVRPFLFAKPTGSGIHYHSFSTLLNSSSVKDLLVTIHFRRHCRAAHPKPINFAVWGLLHLFESNFLESVNNRRSFIGSLWWGRISLWYSIHLSIEVYVCILVTSVLDVRNPEPWNEIYFVIGIVISCPYEQAMDLGMCHSFE